MLLKHLGLVAGLLGGVAVSSGCVSWHVDRYLDDRCENTRIDCRCRDQTGTSKVDQKAWEADKAIGRAMVDAVTPESERPKVKPPHEGPDSHLLCGEEEQKVCSASEGCRCDSAGSNAADP